MNNNIIYVKKLCQYTKEINEYKKLKYVDKLQKGGSFPATIEFQKGKITIGKITIDMLPPDGSTFKAIGKGASGVVYSVIINDELYALKQFSHTNSIENELGVLLHTKLDKNNKDVHIEGICPLKYYDLTNKMLIYKYCGKSLTKFPPDILKILTFLQDLIILLVRIYEENNVIHNDVKTDNVLFDKDFKPILIDFGIARGIDELFKYNGKYDKTLADDVILNTENSFITTFEVFSMQHYEYSKNILLYNSNKKITTKDELKSALLKCFYPSIIDIIFTIFYKYSYHTFLITNLNINVIEEDQSYYRWKYLEPIYNFYEEMLVNHSLIHTNFIKKIQIKYIPSEISGYGIEIEDIMEMLLTQEEPDEIIEKISIMISVL